ncbi:ABC transporter substrate-binding protein [Chelatococcus reniformis]|uniref:ABC transporter permease n=1 Tax=Chelatococcus reniformis TaxID=1494448 RepID=A0A916UXK9_9HYPH|nr:ABC transporter substrate-binding protein [Chelatococcus reniformis]GGC92172.1 ABC transporter permease [Chelatococcus reniformis]
MRAFIRQSMLRSAMVGAAMAAALVAARAADDTVKLGVLNDRSGPYADASGQGSVIMAELAVADFGGKALGKPIEIVAGDHQNKTDVGASIASKWLDTEGVDVILDVPNSAVLLALQELVRNKAGLLMASGGGASTFSGKFCSPYGFQWSYDTYALANGAGRALARQGLKSWYLLQVDYAFGEAMAGDLDKVVGAAGGQIIGRVKTPLNTADFSSFLLQAQGSKAQVVALLNAGNDTINSVKQANEFGLPQGGQRLFGVIFFELDAKAVGLKNAQGLTTTSPFYWAQSPEAEAVSRRFMAKTGKAPTWVQIGVYSAALQYLKAVAAAGTTERDAVAAKLRELPVDDAFVKGGKVRADGRMEHDMLLTEVKSPADSKSEWDVFKVLEVIPGKDAVRPLDGSCPLVKG